MSATINTIPASTIVNITPSVIAAGGSALDLIGLMLTTNTRIPIGDVLSFPTLVAVGDYFGATTNEYNEAQVYFSGYIGGNKLPGSLLMAQYPTANVSAYLRGGDVSNLTLTQLQAIGGVLTVTIDGTPETSSSINLSSATSFTGAAEIIATDLGLAGPVQASITASIGATFTGTATGTALAATSVTGVIHTGDTITGTGISGTVTIFAQVSGSTGGAGTYTTSASTTASSASVTATSSTLDVTHVGSGTIALGQLLVGSGVSGSTYITAFGTGTGQVGTYTLTAVAQIASETMTLEYPTVNYDSVSGSFVVTSPTTGASSTISFGSGTISSALKLTQATGAVTSQGAAAASPATFMNSVTAQTQNWATFLTLFDPDAGSGNTQKLAFAQWNNGQNQRYLYATWDHDILPTESTAATTSLGYILKLNGYSGTAAIYEPSGTNLHDAAFLAGFVASLDFTETNGRATAAFKGQAGLVASVTDATSAANLVANGYNFYGDYATASQQFQFFYPGSVSGEFTWIDSYVNQIQLNAALQQTLMSLLTTVKSIPYNPAGYGLIRAALGDPIAAAVNFGTIRTGVPLSQAQAAEVNNAAGVKIDQVLSTQGWYLQILAATPQVRAARQSPPITLWYLDGESVQQIAMASILIQ